MIPSLPGGSRSHGIKARPFSGRPQSAREVILVGNKPAPGGVLAWRDLITRITRGSAVVFLCPEVFAEGNQPTRWLPLCGKGGLVAGSDLYIRDEWTKQHPIFAGLPCGGLMDYTFYREIIGPAAFHGPGHSDRGGGRSDSPGHTRERICFRLSHVRLSHGGGNVRPQHARIRETLGANPVAERLLRNMLNYAARDMSRPLAELPADFPSQLKAIKYE